MQIGVLKCKNEPLVAIIPKGVATLIQMGHQVQVEKGAGVESLYFDKGYSEQGAKISDRNTIIKTSDVLITVSGLKISELRKAKEGAFLIGKFHMDAEKKLIEIADARDIYVFNLELIPRSSIAQSMDILSSQGSLSGYKAVISAADRFQGYMSMMTTAAGTIPPARVLILGAGVAGLQAIATARRLGAVVEAFDVRSAVREEVESLGATFIEVEGGQEDSSAGGYAIKQSEEYIKRQQDLIHERASISDVVITTALIPRKKAPVLIKKRTVDAMMPGSVIVDLASEAGGNCELTVDGREIVYSNVTIIGDSKLYHKLPYEASRKFNNNVINFIKFVFRDKHNGSKVDFDHDILKSTLLHLPKVNLQSAS